MKAHDYFIEVGFKYKVNHKLGLVEYNINEFSILFKKSDEGIGFAYVDLSHRSIIFSNTILLERATQWINENNEHFDELFEKEGETNDNITKN